ncbi:MAG: threonylcarbamoyl-AMP synthase [Bacteroides sp.]|nr:threonylcarbamoyl-AMP synthase [Bacteroides sp.]
MTFEEDIKEAVAVLKKGGVILYPTDTVWGLGCDATNPEAVKKIYELKRREESKSMLVLVDGEAMLDRTVEDIPEVAWQLIEAAIDPLTIIYDHPHGVASNLLADDGSLGLRITSERYSRELCKRLRRPIVSTSANISGEKAPALFSEISEDIRNGCDYIAEYRRADTTPHKPSNIIKLSDGGLIKVIR